MQMKAKEAIHLIEDLKDQGKNMQKMFEFFENNDELKNQIEEGASMGLSVCNLLAKQINLSQKVMSIINDKLNDADVYF